MVYDQNNLPIAIHRREILEELKNHQVILIAVGTGCEKPTQIPRFLLEADFDKIVCTQPRLIACISLTKRVSYETLNEYENQVGYQVRFEKTRVKSTRIIFMTDDILLRQLQSDSSLSNYDILVIDEEYMNYPSTDRGDMLIFLSGMAEIQAVMEAAQSCAQETQHWIVLPLHSALLLEEQDKVFDMPPEGICRKCVIVTNIAETSVTIDGVRFIIDSGKKYEYLSFQEYSTSEIRCVALDSLMLKIIFMGLKDPRKFPFVESPDKTAIDSALRRLQQQAALSTIDCSLTSIGAMLARLPVDVSIGKMLIFACIFQVKSDGQNTRTWCRRRGVEEQRLDDITKLRRQFQDILRV
ncbi:unnamed protein product [Rotaria sp. Silwood2]|nr:unnamed protein product [Rotaria sp. Silwood2]CAF2907749.1 unnamed protein product [Rotaria sp. Silwood2]CAF3357978.1 unnamed protein product [Rotaria sp. Silwood2]